MKYYHYNQNNSGGSFRFDEKAGITHHVLIQAKNIEQADSKAEEIGLYFEGCTSGRDCNCCGDRWSRQWSEEDGKDEPLVYGSHVDSLEAYLSLWMAEGKETAVHHADGRVTWHGRKKEVK